LNEIIPGLVNLGLGGVMAAALIWFLYHLVTRTLPQMNRAYRKALLAERKLRFREHQALLRIIEQHRKEDHEEHEALLNHSSTGLKELTRAITDALAALEQRVAALLAAGITPAPGTRQRH
jgi:hypothetical protein